MTLQTGDPPGRPTAAAWERSAMTLSSPEDRRAQRLWHSGATDRSDLFHILLETWHRLSQLYQLRQEIHPRGLGSPDNPCPLTLTHRRFSTISRYSTIRCSGR